MAAEQTVGLRLDLDADDLKRELAASGKAADQLAGDMQGMGGRIDAVMRGLVGSAAGVEEGIRGVDQRLELLTGADREVFLTANIGQAQQALRQLDQMLTDPTMTDPEIRIVLDQRNQVSAQIDKLKGDLGELEQAVQDVGYEGERSFGALAGAIGSAGAASRIDEAVTSSGRLRAQLGLTADEALEFDSIAKTVYRDNFGDSMGDAAQTVGQVHQALRLTGDELLTTTEGVFAIRDAFEHLGADVDTTLNATRTMKANFPGMDEAGVLDLIASGFQNGAGRAGDFIDVLNEYPGDFARIGLSAEDMVGIINEGLDAGVWNADRVGDAVREMGIRITTAGDTGQDAIRAMFPADEAERLISDFGRGGEAGRDAFFTILDGLTQVEDPAERFNLSVELMGTLGEELANQFPAMRDGLLEVRDGAQEAGTGVEGLSGQYDGFRNTIDGFLRSLETSALGTLGDVGLGFADVGANVGIAVLGFQGLKDVIPGLRGLGGVGGNLARIAGGAAAYTAGAAGISLLADSLADLAGWSGMDLSNLAADLELLARTGDPGNVNVDRIALAIDEIIDPSFWESAGGTISRGIDTVGQVVSLGFLDLRGTAKQYDEELGAIDQALVAMVQSGNGEQAAAVFEQISGAIEDSGHDVGLAADAFPAYATALELATARAGGLPGVLADAIFGVDGLAGTTEDATGTQRDYNDELDETYRSLNDLLDPFANAWDALDAHHEAQQRVVGAQMEAAAAQDAYNEAVRTFGADSPEATDAAWALMEAQAAVDDANRDAFRSAQDVQNAVNSLAGEMENAGLSVDDARAQLALWVEQGLLTEEQAAQVAEELGIAAWNAEQLGGKNVLVPVGMDASEFWAERARVAQAMYDLTGTVHVGGGVQVKHGGGAIHGYPGQEVDVRALAGEYVIRAEAAQAIGYDALHALNRGEMPVTYMAAPSSGGGGGGMSIDYERLAAAGGVQVIVHKGDQIDENTVAALVARKLA